mmetsp:Transcript_10805/g.28736  ORF Transcript_10805/g.28736 Transcript_10805/m.28736 type:complete len:333 (+) Transcript_10805:530-1528(+)
MWESMEPRCGPARVPRSKSTDARSCPSFDASNSTSSPSSSSRPNSSGPASFTAATSCSRSVRSSAESVAPLQPASSGRSAASACAKGRWHAASTGGVSTARGGGRANGSARSHSACSVCEARSRKPPTGGDGRSAGGGEGECRGSERGVQGCGRGQGCGAGACCRTRRCWWARGVRAIFAPASLLEASAPRCPPPPTPGATAASKVRSALLLRPPALPAQAPSQCGGRSSSATSSCRDVTSECGPPATCELGGKATSCAFKAAALSAAAVALPAAAAPPPATAAAEAADAAAAAGADDDDDEALRTARSKLTSSSAMCADSASMSCDPALPT